MIDTLRSRFAAAPDSRAFVPLAEELRRLGMLEEALTLLETELKKHPHFSSGLVVLGRILLDAGSPERARQVLSRVREIDSDNLLILNLLLDDAGGRGAWQEAIALVRDLARLEPDNSHWTHLQAKLSQVLSSAQTLGEYQPPGSEPSGQTEESGSEGEDPSSPPLELADLATMTLVDIYLEQGYRKKALATLEMMAGHDPDNLEVQKRIQELGQRKGMDAEDQHGMARALALLKEPSDRSAAREGQKQQFQEWLSRIRKETD